MVADRTRGVEIPRLEMKESKAVVSAGCYLFQYVNQYPKWTTDAGKGENGPG